MEHLQHCLGFRHGLPEASVHGHFQAGFKGSPKDLVSWYGDGTRKKSHGTVIQVKSGESANRLIKQHSSLEKIQLQDVIEIRPHGRCEGAWSEFALRASIALQSL
jgi:hypothetical protein